MENRISSRFDAYDFFVRQLRIRLDRAERCGFPMVREKIQDLQDLIKNSIRSKNEEIQACVPSDLKPYKIRKPRNAEEIEKLKEEYKSDLFVRRVKVDEKCSCAEGYTAVPVPGCQECQGTGLRLIGTTRCVCTKCTKKSLKQLDGRWTCVSCGWVDIQPEFGGKPVSGKVTKPKLLTAMKTIHDEDIATGKYVCPKCQGAREMQATKTCVCTKRMKYDSNCVKCHGTGIFKGFDDRYCIRQPFNLNSYDQLKNYAIARNHRIPYGGLGRDGLQQLARQTGDPVYRLAYEVRLFDQIAGFGTQLGISSLGPDEIVRVHTQFMFTSGDGKITTKNPNINASPNPIKYPEIAAAWRQCVASGSTGWKMIRATFEDIHYWTFGLEAQDEVWLSAIRIGFEDWLLKAGNVRPDGATYSLQQIAMAKSAIFGFMRERSATWIHQRNRHLFSSLGMVEHLLGVLIRNFPRSVEFKGLIARQAHKQKFLMSKFGYRRDFYNIIHQDRNLGYSAASDLSNAVSFLPSNHAYSTMALSLRWLDEVRDIELINVYEDGFLFEIAGEYWVDHLKPIEDGLSEMANAGILEHPSGEAFSLRVKVETL